MDKTEVEKVTPVPDDGSHLNRNRSFKSKQLVRSQAIRESHSPPRTISPYPTSPVNEPKASESKPAEKKENADNSSDSAEERKPEDKKQPVEIQITTGSWESDPSSEQRQRTKRWLGNRHHSDSSRSLLSHSPRLACVCGACECANCRKFHSDSSRSLLSHSPRLACVCGACECANCRGQRRKHDCPVKQDSGIACSVEYPDCDFDRLSANGDGVRKSGSFEDQSLYGRGSDRRDRQRNFSFTRSDSDIAEPSWPELVSFIKATLNKNARDRETLLRVEKDLHAFVNDPGRCIVRFPTMTSYGRMLVHRCAALFQLAHRMDLHHRNTVLVSKGGTSGGRIPCTSFAQWCTVSFPKSPSRNEEETAAKSILKRSSCGEAGGASAGGNASRSLEQRERDYERVRRRIFTTDKAGQDSEWPWLPTGPIKLLTPDPGRNKLIKVQSLESRGATDSGPRGPVSKSHSLDGYGAEQSQTRLLSRQGDLASSSWRLSPSSSGYKTLSLRSTDSVTPSPTGCPSPDSTARSSTPTAPVEGDAVANTSHAVPTGSAVVWAVTDMSAVPPGAIVIHPQTGRPLTNSDGSVYHFDPANPPVIQDDAVYLQNGHQDANAEKRRGRLEKQHSFIENECDYPSEQCEVKCNCDCNEQESAKCAMEQLTLSPHSSKANSTPNSPKRPEAVTLTNNSPESTNQRPSYDNPANQRTLYDTATNQRVSYDSPANQRPEITTNQYSPSRARRNYNPLQRYDQRYANLKYESTQNQVIEVSARMGLEATNQRTPVEVPVNQRPEVVSNRMPEVSANQRAAVDSAANQRPFEGQRFEIQRPPSYDQVQRSEGRTSDGVSYVQNYVQYRNDETPPQIPSHYQPTDMAEMQAMLAQKITPMPIADPNIRPMPIAANMMYPTAIHQGYQYVNACRLEQPLQPLYPPLVQPLLPAASVLPDEHKHLPPSPHTDSTFRIDPSYPYATDFNAACGACSDPNALQHQQRSVSVGYGQIEMPQAVVPQPYQMHNVMPQIQPYPYQEALAWQSMSLMGGPSGASGPGGPTTQKLMMPDVYPVVCPAIYPPCGVIYPQMIPQPYQICPPVYPVIDKQPEVYQQRIYNQRQSKRNSISGSSRTTPQTPDEKKTYDDKNINSRDLNINNRVIDVSNRDVMSRDASQNQDQSIKPASNNRTVDETNHLPVEQRGSEIAETIAQIKEQLALNKERDRGGRGREEWRRRNSGGGILGSYPVNNYNSRVVGRPANEESQINPAIFNSIRNFQAKQNYQHQERRVYELASSRFDARYDGRRRPERDERPQQDVRLQQRACRAVNVPFQLRPPYLFRQMTPNTWSRRSPGMIPPVMNHPRRPHPERNPRR